MNHPLHYHDVIITLSQVSHCENGPRFHPAFGPTRCSRPLPRGDTSRCARDISTACQAGMRKGGKGGRARWTSRQEDDVMRGEGMPSGPFERARERAGECRIGCTFSSLPVGESSYDDALPLFPPLARSVCYLHSALMHRMIIVPP